MLSGEIVKERVGLGYAYFESSPSRERIFSYLRAMKVVRGYVIVEIPSCNEMDAAKEATKNRPRLHSGME